MIRSSASFDKGERLPMEPTSLGFHGKYARSIERGSPGPGPQPWPPPAGGGIPNSFGAAGRDCFLPTKPRRAGARSPAKRPEGRPRGDPPLERRPRGLGGPAAKQGR